LFIALGYQKGFSWKQVAAGAVAGGLSGAAAGAGEAAKVLAEAAQAGKLTPAVASYFEISEAALEVASSASQQLIENGKITSWTGLAAAAVTGYAQGAASVAKGVDINPVLDSTGRKVFEETAKVTAKIASVARYVTPWVTLAETYVRDDGKLTPTDWANAVGSTLADAVSDQYGEKGNTLSAQLTNASLRLGSEALVAGALSAYSKSDAEQYFDDSVGHEAGTLIGNALTNWIQTTHDRNHLKNALDKLGIEYTTDSHGNPQASLAQRSSFDFAKAALATGASIDDIKEAMDALRDPLTRLDQAPGLLEQDAIDARVAKALGPTPQAAQQTQTADPNTTATADPNTAATDPSATVAGAPPESPSQTLRTVYVEAYSRLNPSGSSIISKVISGGAELLQDTAEFYAKHPGLATLLYGGVKAVLSGGPIESVVSQLAKMAMSAINKEIENSLVMKIQDKVSTAIEEFATRRHLSIDLSLGPVEVTAGPKFFGEVGGVFAGAVTLVLMNSGIGPVAQRGVQVNGIVRNLEEDAEKAEQAAVGAGQRAEEEVQQAEQETQQVGERAPLSKEAIAKALHGDSQVLRKNLERAGETVPEGGDYAAHHLIPGHLTEQYPHLFEDAAQNGYDINAAENGWMLPTKSDLAEELDLPLHRGKHLGEYFRAARDELDQLQEAYNNPEIGLKAADLPRELNKISNVLKGKLEDLDLFLQKTDPRYKPKSLR